MNFLVWKLFFKNQFCVLCWVEQNVTEELKLVIDNHADSRWEGEFYVVLDNHVDSRWEGGALCCPRQPCRFKVGALCCPR